MLAKLKYDGRDAGVVVFCRVKSLQCNITVVSVVELPDLAEFIPGPPRHHPWQSSGKSWRMGGPCQIGDVRASLYSKVDMDQHTDIGNAGIGG